MDEPNPLLAADDDCLYQRLLNTIAEETSYPRKKLTLDTIIQYDIGTEGDDAVELFERISRDFNVDMAGFDFHKHFYNEGLSFVPDLPQPKTAITVNDLYQAVRAGVWVEPTNASPVEVNIGRQKAGCIIMLVLMAFVIALCTVVSWWLRTSIFCQ